ERPDGVRVTLTDGAILDADLLVGADGIHSLVRRVCFGPESDFVRYLGLHTAAVVFQDADLHAEIANTFTLTDTIDRQVGMYALRGQRVAVFTVHRTDDPAIPRDPRAEMRRVYGSLGWRVPDVLAHLPEPADLYYDQVAQVVMRR